MSKDPYDEADTPVDEFDAMWEEGEPVTAIPYVSGIDDLVGHWNPGAGSFRIKEGDDWVISIMPMIFNDRVIFSYKDEYPNYSAGWCYDKGGAAALAAAAWDPDTQRKPVGYKKEAVDAR